jgi:hypothetical protein
MLEFGNKCAESKPEPISLTDLPSHPQLSPNSKTGHRQAMIGWRCRPSADRTETWDDSTRFGEETADMSVLGI